MHESSSAARTPTRDLDIHHYLAFFSLIDNLSYSITTKIYEELMENTPIPTKHYAILIGINAYQKKPLKGCVRDVKAIQKYFDGCSNMKPLVMEIFTAGEDADSEPTSPLHKPNLKPTYANVISAFEEVACKADSGAFVYVHFSGHGTRATPDSRFSNLSTGDLALVLLDKEDGIATRCLWGPRLASLVNAMVNRGLVVTLVLDCCFYASVYRLDDPETRFLPYSSGIDSEAQVDPETVLETESNDSGSRDISMLPNWLINPDGYTILVACGPDEEAREPKFDGKRHGALSYCLLKTLGECGGLVRRHKDIYNHLCSTFRRFRFSFQTPVLYGNSNLGFFGPATTDMNMTATSVLVKKDGSLNVPVGQAHGVSDGDQFALSPFSPTEIDDISQVGSVVAKVIYTGPFSSILEQMSKTSIQVQTGWMASPIFWLGLRKFPVKLDITLPHRDTLREVLQDRSLDVRSHTDNRPYSFHIVENGECYEIWDGSSQKLNNIPRMTLGETDTNQLYTVLEHLARYNMVRELSNEITTATFTDSFGVHVTNQLGEVLVTGRCHQVNQDETVKITLKFENKGDKPLYVAIYNLGPRWEVKNIYHGTYEVVPPLNTAERFTGEMQKKMKLKVPPELKELGLRQCEDIIKIFITSEPTSFDILELPKLGEPWKRRTSFTETDRGGNLARREWATLTFPIRTALM